MPARIRGLNVWLRRHPTLSDALGAAFVLAIGIPQMLYQHIYTEAGYRRPDALQLVVVSLLAISLAFRQRAPLSVLALSIAGSTFLAIGHYQPTLAEVLVFLIVVYTVAAHRALAHSAMAGTIAFAAFWVFLLIAPQRPDLIGFATDTALFIGIWWLGRSLRLRRAYLAELEDRAARLERARGTDARAARVEERSRIARELHDVVAHHVSVMTVQAGAARRILDRNPESAREAMTTIEEVGRAALSEMRRIVGVLRTERDVATGSCELAPQPGIDDVGSLVDHVRETGLYVQLKIEGDRPALPPGVDLAAFRLIQEALTNTLKHAGPMARAWVHIAYSDRDVSVEIGDDGKGAAASLGADGGDGDGRDAHGHGLVGMYERVALYGGELRIGPRVGGGFQVRARFPVEG